MSRPAVGALTAIWIAAAAPAEEAGELVLEIDGESHGFSLWAEQSDWSGSGQYGSVNIYSRPAEGRTSELYGVFTLGFEFMNGEPDIVESSLIRIVDGERVRLFASSDAGESGLVIEIGTLAVDGEELALGGTFTTSMGPSDTFGREIDMANAVAVNGRFDVVLGPVE